MRRSDSIDVPLRIYGTRAQSLEFRIRAAPRAGKLSDVRQLAQERAVVTYTPPPDHAIDSDQFSYAVRSKEGVSAAANVMVQIVDDPAKLVTPSEIDFGMSIVGGEAVRQLEIVNEGGSVAAGRVETVPPWRIDPPAEYHLEAGARAAFAVRFEPKEKGAFRGEVHFSSEPAHTTQLRGTGQPAVCFEPPRIELKCPGGESPRSGSFSAVNQSASEVSLTFIGSDRLQFVRALKLAPHETRRIDVALADDDPAKLSAELRAEPHGMIEVEAEALPARFVATHRAVALIRSAGGRETNSIRIENRGGMAAEARLVMTAPFTVEPAVIRLAPRESVNATITAPASDNPIGLRGELVVTGGERPLRVDVESDATLAPQASLAARTTHEVPLVKVNAVARTNSAGNFFDNREAVFPQPIYPREIENGRAVIEWPASMASASTFRAQEQQVSLRGGEVQIDWRDYPAFQTDRKGAQIVGTFTNLQPARLYVMRVVPVSDNGRAGPPLVEVRFRTAPKKPSRFKITPLSVLVVLFCAGAVFAIRQRFKAG
ncbi:MAG TPA: fibronectin type III domain-containing protein [Chthoniobacteraceae bacterium]|nr:fibronectin type III domain-containing protein [Chthoniobacteraceae bacterium]